MTIPRPNSAREGCRTEAYRITKRQAEALALRERVSELNNQNYILAELIDEEVVVRPFSRLHKALKGIMGESMRNCSGSALESLWVRSLKARSRY